METGQPQRTAGLCGYAVYYTYIHTYNFLYVTTLLDLNFEKEPIFSPQALISPLRLWTVTIHPAPESGEEKGTRSSLRSYQ